MKIKAPASVGDRRGQLQSLAVGLAQCCPVDHSNPANCPLSDLRRLSTRAQRAWIRQLSADELAYLVTYHALCAAEKRGQVTAGGDDGSLPPFPDERGRDGGPLDLARFPR